MYFIDRPQQDHRSAVGTAVGPTVRNVRSHKSSDVHFLSTGRKPCVGDGPKFMRHGISDSQISSRQSLVQCEHTCVRELDMCCSRHHCPIAPLHEH